MYYTSMKISIDILSYYNYNLRETLESRLTSLEAGLVGSDRHLLRAGQQPLHELAGVQQVVE